MSGKKGQEGKLQGYVYLSDGRLLNEEIVRAGYARVTVSHSDVRFKKDSWTPLRKPEHIGVDCGDLHEPHRKKQDYGLRDYTNTMSLIYTCMTCQLFVLLTTYTP